jgi:hypothetical protein
MRSAPSKPPDAAVNPIGAAARWSWKLLTSQKSWVVACARLVDHELGLVWFHAQPPGGQLPAP